MPINIINVYGAQESRTSTDIIKQHWDEIVEEIRKIELRGEVFILISDLNKHLGAYIKGNNNDKVTAGGRLILDFLDDDRYALVNNLSTVENGPYTR